ncbi:winged helix-turn-helix domain-containing protein [Catalinimonas alkaloidigena]|uniref:winged helix-turn-helix domain-containing protein n=1 Tax=Catalinimonas alkaloidigena TaxID=1075417 RepID=UPI00240517E5|nr:winged helix-turn-helix domain-containing protein [Catalinimonas alkaloidigena]
MKSTLRFAGLFSLLTLLLSAVALYGTDEHTVFLKKRAPLVIRKIGHKLLLHAGDSSSRVLPVKQIDETTFQLEFQRTFSFVPDSLVEVVRVNLAENNLPMEYVVNVLECYAHEVVYGFAMGEEYRDIVPCEGRVQPEGCYAVQITFDDFAVSGTKNKHYFLFTLALSSLVVIGFIGKVWIKNRQQLTEREARAFIPLGSYTFDQRQGKLMNRHQSISLSDKESRLMTIFALQQNELIERDRLLKEVWEDEGVFTGRSLDVFISRLRKKLQDDPSVRLANVHGKGYRLEVDT